MTRAWKLVLPGVLAGLLAGVWIGARFERSAQKRIRRDGPSPERVLKKLRRELDLTPVQTESIRSIMASHKGKFVAARREGAARLAELRRGVDKEIEPLLDERQKAKFAALRERWEKRMREEVPPDEKKP